MNRLFSKPVWKTAFDLSDYKKNDQDTHAPRKFLSKEDSLLVLGWSIALLTLSQIKLKKNPQPNRRKMERKKLSTVNLNEALSLSVSII